MKIAILNSYGKPVTAAKTRAIITAPLDPENPGPHARFIFRYRTLGKYKAHNNSGFHYCSLFIVFMAWAP